MQPDSKLEAAGKLQTFVAGEIVIPYGQVISALDIEALGVFGLAQSENKWQEVASAVSLVLLFTAFFVIYLRRKPILKAGEYDIRGMTLLVALFLSFLLLGRLTIPGHTVIPYLYPVMAYGLLSHAFGAELPDYRPTAFLLLHTDCRMP
jgi:membrane-associated HD superfamily phosphohydrolase